ncbi:TadE/TadG family type IV pilus assembly protein [Caulobacter sp. 17J80-11]|uniref:TadE/TadG family type IV pilus assembly protein n=1 Tax=Caulobacter sp. 17J80-11 TaxID=2763502 RepID=UPI0016539F28|nr:TadE/TadG family type IV pilus assembly protein [Caulobacter sp. 17J80-11]MBC6982143.1 pilus assembly protein [Caulobacter sp. 17J80-11]
MRGLKKFLKDCGGASAVEFALIVPILSGAAVMTYDLWTGSRGVLAMRAGVEAGAQYIRGGGSSDATAKTIALASWKDKPRNAAVTVSRSCKCGSAANVCTGLCASTQTPPQVFVTFAASGTGTGVFLKQTLKDTQVVRVR